MPLCILLFRSSTMFGPSFLYVFFPLFYFIYLKKKKTLLPNYKTKPGLTVNISKVLSFFHTSENKNKFLHGLETSSVKLKFKIV